ncbi:MAG TPA: carbon-nitrogen family hydrolase [Ignavibacteriaceae bacterium]|nr:carbon-nitrogen family hydrolase [Ignavibacteriaceae bacterium]
MRVGLIQYDPEWENKKMNSDKISWLLSHNYEKQELLVFPEMTLTGFTMKAAEYAEELNGESFSFFSELAKKYTAHILAGIIEKSEKKYYNSLVHINPEGKLLKTYRKIHPFSFSAEDKNYAKGEETVLTKINDLNTGLSICYDLRFPELYRQYAKKKADMIVVIANWPDTRIEHWRTLLRARAIENQCYVLGVNRVGNDPELKYIGYSAVVDPMGNEIISVSPEEKIVTAEVFKDKADEIKAGLPFLNDIRLI